MDNFLLNTRLEVSLFVTHPIHLARKSDIPDDPSATRRTRQGWQVWHPNWVILAQNGTNLSFYKISFSTFWLGETKRTETDLKKSQICPIWGQSDPIWMPNLTFLPVKAMKTWAELLACCGV